MTGYKHGFAKPESRNPTYRSWECARARCRNPNDPSYPQYGGRGIKFSSAWDKFPDFLADMGHRPRGHSLDRIDVDRDYEPTNCRWATAKQQARNKRNNVVVTYCGQTLTLMELAEATGLPYQRLNERIVRRGWTVERAVMEAPRGW